MVDEVVILTPLLVLGVILVLGFAGCSFEGAVGPPRLYMRARVPTALTVTQVLFVWESPSVRRDQALLEGDALKPFVDGDDNVFQHSVELPLTDTEPRVPVSETWTVRCQVTVQGGATPGPSANGMFTLDGSIGFPVATFQAAGDAATLTLSFQGVQ